MWQQGAPVLTNELFMQFQFQFADCPKLHLLQSLSETETAYGLFAYAQRIAI